MAMDRATGAELVCGPGKFPTGIAQALVQVTSIRQSVCLTELEFHSINTHRAKRNAMQMEGAVLLGEFGRKVPGGASNPTFAPSSSTPSTSRFVKSSTPTIAPSSFMRLLQATREH